VIHFTLPLNKGQTFDPHLSILLDILLHSEEYHREELLRCKRLRELLERRIPDDRSNLFQQIEDILTDLDSPTGKQ